MENQHRQIKGYRDLSQEEIDLMNEIKEKAADVGELVQKLREFQTTVPSEATPGTPDQRWVAIGQTHLQQGFMALTRSVAKPDFF